MNTQKQFAEPIPGWWAWVLLASIAVILSACQMSPQGAANLMVPGRATTAGKTAFTTDVAAARSAPATAAAPGTPSPSGVVPVSHQEVADEAGEASAVSRTTPGPAVGARPVPPQMALAEARAQTQKQMAMYHGMPPSMMGPMPAGIMMPPPIPQATGHTCAPGGCGCCSPRPAKQLPGSQGCGPYFPEDEYICDGGDRPQDVMVDRDYNVLGLDQEDTVAHYDTLDGKTKIERSNRVCIYAPRFAAVRVVDGVRLNEQIVGSKGAYQPLHIRRADESLPVIARTQNLPPTGALALDRMDLLKGRQYSGLASQTLAVFDYTKDLLPFENMSIIRYGVLDANEKAMLAQAVQNAIVWTHIQAVQVVLDGQRATEAVGDQKAQEAVRVHACGPSKLAICKIASTNAAQPGDIIDFTLRFDNVGDRTIGNVVIMDNLTTRLDYVEGSAQASCKAGYEVDKNGEIVRNEKGQPIYRQNPITFTTQVNEGESLVLRWELAEPLKPGEGGIIRFKCRVR